MQLRSCPSSWNFQPEAEVGRTRFSARPATADACWKEICAGVGLDLAKDHLWFGHPDCTHWVTLAVLYPERRVVNLFPGDSESRALWDALLDTFGGVGSREARSLTANLRRLALILRRPSVLIVAWRYTRSLLRRERLGFFQVLRLLVRRRVAFLNIVQHNFMNAEEVRSKSDTVKRRLAACSFRGAVRNGDGWEAVPMCSMNVEQRQELYAAQAAGGSGRHHHDEKDGPREPAKGRSSP